MPDLETQIARIRTSGLPQAWRTPTIRDALSVPAIQRAVSLIANTAGSLSIEAYRNNRRLDTADAPRVVVRPDPYCTPRDFYRDSAYNMATRGEVVWWIASRDADDVPAALIVVPLAELTVEENPRNRLLPLYRWEGTNVRVAGTRYSPAHKSGDFVHVTYLKEPGALRGSGPLQLCGAAASVSVEAQAWAANFYADGGHPSLVVKTARDLEDMTDAEMAAFEAQWIGKANNLPRFIDGGVESVTELQPNPQGAQMLDARQHQNGDAARMFGIPGSLLEYQVSGSSLTYQNVESEFTKFVRTSLAPNYLEPIEQAMSDLLTRSTVARFNVKGFLRADAKTRAEIYDKLVPLGVVTVEEARQEEGYAPGDVEFAPVPFTPPAAIPASLPSTRSAAEPLRCDGMRQKRRSGITRLERCNALLNATGPDYVGTCRKCKKVYPAA